MSKQKVKPYSAEFKERAVKLAVGIGQTNAILALAPPVRNLENTPGAFSRPSPAPAAHSRRRWLPQHLAAQDGVGLSLKGSLGSKASGRPIWGKLGAGLSGCGGSAVVKIKDFLLE
jgi:hypothetical protein